MQRALSEWERERIREVANDLLAGKAARKTKGKGDIAKHYRAQLDEMKQLRECGVTGRIDFEDFF